MGRVSDFFPQMHHGETENLISATLVDESEGVVVVAERVGFAERRWKTFVSAILLASTSVVLAVFFIPREVDDVVRPPSEELFPSMQPSFSPSFDLRPTLEIVRARGHLRCGFEKGVASGPMRVMRVRRVKLVSFSLNLQFSSL